MGPCKHLLYKLSDADLHAILNTIADKVQTHFANNKVMKEETKSKPLASNPKPQNDDMSKTSCGQSQNR